MPVHPLRKMNNAYFGMKKLLDRAETDHRTKAGKLHCIEVVVVCVSGMALGALP